MKSKALPLIAFMLFGGGCFEPSPDSAVSHNSERAVHQMPPVRHPSKPSLSASPIAVPFSSYPVMRIDRAASSCLSINVEIVPATGDRGTKGILVANNKCDSSMALLVNPVETYYRTTKSEFFVPTTIVDPAYAILYVFRSDLGIGKDSFIGDGGLEVFSWPEVAIIPARSSREMPLIGAGRMFRGLIPGRYSAIFSTVAVPTPLRTGGVSVIDLGRDVKSFNSEKKSERAQIRSDASLVVSPASDFVVSPR